MIMKNKEEIVIVLEIKEIVCAFSWEVFCIMKLLYLSSLWVTPRYLNCDITSQTTKKHVAVVMFIKNSISIQNIL